MEYNIDEESIKTSQIQGGPVQVQMVERSEYKLSINRGKSFLHV